MSRSGHQVSQNVDNFMRDKPSTRLHAPPGGGSSVGSLIYGGGGNESQFAGYERRGSGSGNGRGGLKNETPEQTNLYNKTPPQQQQQHQHQQSYQHQQQQSYQQQQQPPTQAAAGVRQGSSNAYASGANQNAGNVLTDRRITRIHAPPGGASSFRLG